MNKQTVMVLDSPDLSLEQRRLLQAWLKIIKRKASEKPVHIRPNFLSWCLRQARTELTPANFNYFQKPAQKARIEAYRAYEKHIKAVRSQNGL